MLRRRGLLAAAVNCTFVADENYTLGTCPFYRLELHEIGKLRATRTLWSSSCRTF